MENSFEEDLRRGQNVENDVLAKVRKKHPCATLIKGKWKPYDLFIPETGQKIEIKADWKSNDTGNILIELEMFGKLSALMTTEADLWVVFTGKEYLWVKPSRIIECIIFNNIRSRELTGTGDSASKIACLIPIKTFKAYCL